MSITRIVFILTCGVAVGVGVGLSRAARGRPIWERLGIAALPFLGCTVAWHWLVSLTFHAVATFWDKTSLAAAMGLAYGYSLNRPIHRGPVEDEFNGSLSALAYAPALLLGHSGLQLLGARTLSLIYYYGPAAWLLLRNGEDPRELKTRWWEGPRLGSLLLFIAFVLLTTNLRALRASPTEVHADAPALALAALAVVVMVRGGGGQNAWASSLALMLASVAVWALQLAVPLLLVALPGFALATGARKRLSRWLLPALVGGAAIALILLAAFDTSRLGSGSIVAPFRGRSWLDLLNPLILFQEKHAPLLYLLAVGLVGRVGAASEALGSHATSASTRFRLQFRDAEWILFLILGLAELVFSALGYFEPVMSAHTLAFSLYYLSLGSLLMIKPFIMQIYKNECVNTLGPPPWGWYLVLGLNLMLAGLADQALAIALVESKGVGHATVPTVRSESLSRLGTSGLLRDREKSSSQGVEAVSRLRISSERNPAGRPCENSE